MAERGRKSAASLSVVAGTIGTRPSAPSDLTKSQKETWDRTVANEAADMFKTAALQQLLKEFCRHSDTETRLSKQVEVAMAEGAEVDLGALDKLLKMRDRETRAVVTLATKLRITNQSRYTAEAAGTKARRAQSETKPWQMAG